MRHQIYFASTAMAVLIAFAFCCIPVFAQSFDLETFPSEGATLWHSALSANNGEVVAIMNNRPFAFDQSPEYKGAKIQAEPVLEEALAVARRYEAGYPRDLVYSLCNLGSLKYLSEEYNAADMLFKEAVEVADKHIVKDSISLAGVLDLAAMAARAAYDDNRAEALCIRSFHMRQNLLGAKHPDVAYSLMNLSCAYADQALSGNSLAEKRALKLHADIDNRTHPNYYINTGDWRWTGNPSPIPDRFASYGIPYTHDLSHKLGRPVHPGAATLPDMVAFAQSIINKHKQRIVTPPPEPGLASVTGNWGVRTDVETSAVVKTDEVNEMTPEGAEHRSGSSEQHSKFAGVEIFLCPRSSYPMIWDTIKAFGDERGLRLDELGVTWPANHKQAQSLLLAAQNTARGVALKSQTTDKNGDYDFTDIPKGAYFTFAVLATQAQCRMWFLPSIDHAIVVTRLWQFTVNFTEDNGRTIWPLQMRVPSSAGLGKRIPQTSAQPSPYLTQPPQP